MPVLFHLLDSQDKALQGPPGVMLPTPSKFCAAMRYLGIEKDDHIVCYDTMGFWMTARGAWMLKVRFVLSRPCSFINQGFIELTIWRWR